MLISLIVRLRQILVNLLGNSIKFSSKGAVVVKLFCSDVNSNTCKLLFSVEDNGIGIPEDRKSLIFQPFTQADNSISRKFGGTGLGLSISKRLAGMFIE